MIKTNLNKLIGNLVEYDYYIPKGFKPSIGIIIGIKYNDKQIHFHREYYTGESFKVHWTANALPKDFNNNKPNEIQYTLFEVNNKQIKHV